MVVLSYWQSWLASQFPSELISTQYCMVATCKDCSNAIENFAKACTTGYISLVIPTLKYTDILLLLIYQVDKNTVLVTKASCLLCQ